MRWMRGCGPALPQLASPARPLPDAVADELASVLARRRPWLEMRARRAEPPPPRAARLRPALDARAVAHPQLAARDGELDQTLRASPVWREKEALLRSIPGIGPVVAHTGWGSCPNWARWIAGRWRRWPGWRP